MPSKDKAKIAAYKRLRKQDPEAKARDNAYRNEWRKKKRSENLEKARAYDRLYYRQIRSRVLEQKRFRKFGITPEKMSELLEACGNACQVCGKIFGPNNPPHVDHCHKKNVFRGLLCRGCNAAEGHMATSENAYKLYQYMLANEKT